MTPFIAKPSGIQRHLILWISMAVGIMMVLGTLFVGLMVAKQMETEQRVSLRKMAQQELLSMEQQLGHWTREVEHLADHPLMLRGLNDPASKRRLASMVQAWAAEYGLKAFMLVDLEGTPIFSQLDSLSLFKSSPSFKSALARHEVTIHLDVDRGWLVVVAPVRYYQTTQGAMVTGFDLWNILEKGLVRDPSRYYRLKTSNDIISLHHFDAEAHYLSLSQPSHEGTPRLQRLGILLETGILAQKIWNDGLKAGGYFAIFGLIFTLAALLLATRLGKEIDQSLDRLLEDDAQEMTQSPLIEETLWETQVPLLAPLEPEGMRMDTPVTPPLDREKPKESPLRSIPPRTETQLPLPWMDAPQSQEKAWVWPEISGLDVVSGLACAEGDGRKFANLLVEFAEKNQGTIQRLEEMRIKSRYDRMQRDVGGLKEMAIHLGATTLHGAAVELETVLMEYPRKRADVLDSFAKFRGIMEPFLAGLTVWSQSLSE